MHGQSQVGVTALQPQQLPLPVDSSAVHLQALKQQAQHQLEHRCNMINQQKAQLQQALVGAPQVGQGLAMTPISRQVSQQMPQYVTEQVPQQLSLVAPQFQLRQDNSVQFSSTQ